MFKYQTEYSRPQINSPGCNYASLGSYNQNYFGRGRVIVPNMAQTRSAEIIIPSYGGVGYASAAGPSLSAAVARPKVPSCNGYYDQLSAYPNYPQTCGTFASNLCG